jgi:hypothetical protein
MGFFDTLGRLAKGEQPFQNPEEHDGSHSEGQGNHAQTHSGPKHLPEVAIEEFRVHDDGHHMECEASIKNETDKTIELDKVIMLGVKRELDSFLRPHEEREFVIYSGPRPANNYNDDCYLQYKDETGDYFQANHYVELERLQDNTYKIRRIRFIGPIKDI